MLHINTSDYEKVKSRESQNGHYPFDERKLVLASMMVDRLPPSQSTFPEQKEAFIQAQMLQFWYESKFEI